MQLKSLPSPKHRTGAQVRSGQPRFPQIRTGKREVLTLNHPLEGSLTASIQSSEEGFRYVLQQVVRTLPINTTLLNVDTVARAFSNLNNSSFVPNKKKRQSETPANTTDYSSRGKRTSSTLLEYFSTRKVDLGEIKSIRNRNSRGFCSSSG